MSSYKYNFNFFKLSAYATSLPGFIIALILMILVSFGVVAFLTFLVMLALSLTPLAPGFWACVPIAILIAIIAPDTSKSKV